MHISDRLAIQQHFVKFQISYFENKSNKNKIRVNYSQLQQNFQNKQRKLGRWAYMGQPQLIRKSLIYRDSWSFPQAVSVRTAQAGVGQIDYFKRKVAYVSSFILQTGRLCGQQMRQNYCIGVWGKTVLLLKGVHYS